MQRILTRERLLSHERVRKSIARRVYEIYERPGRQEGHNVEDWFQAESQVLSVAPFGEVPETFPLT